MTGPQGGALAATAMIDVDRPVDLDLSAASLWCVVALHRDVPLTVSWLPSPGRVADPAAVLEPHLADARRIAAGRDLAERLAGRVGLRPLPRPRRTCSVAVCAEGPSPGLAAVLAAVGNLDPAPTEVLVVGASDELAAPAVAAGARYVRAHGPGGGPARTAALAAARGDLIAFADVDTLPPPRWLAGVSETFGPPSVAAVTGPPLPAELETPAQVRAELALGSYRELRRAEHEWTTISPLAAARLGARDAVIFRVRALREMAGGFAPDLDAGDAPGAPGATSYALYRLLHAGGVVVHDPARWVLRRSARGPAARAREAGEHGRALGATAARAGVAHRDPEALAEHARLWKRAGRAAAGAVLGTQDPLAARTALAVAGGALAGGRRGVHRAGPARAKEPASAAPAVPSSLPAPRVGAVAAPEVSVVVPTFRRPDAIDRCLRALAGQTLAADRLEVVVVDDTPERSGTLPAWAGGWARLLHTGGIGAAGARNQGAAAARAPHLLFIDDDVIPEPECAEAHLAAGLAVGAPGIVIGHTPPRPPRRNLIAVATSLWWEGFLDEMARAPELRFTDMLSGHASMPAELFRGLGGFDRTLGRLRREDWLFGLRAKRAGVPLTFAREAVAHHEYELTSAGRLRAARWEGGGDAALLARHPEIAPVLLPRREPTPATALARGILARPGGRAAVARLLDELERRGLRALWLRVSGSAQHQSYQSGRSALGAVEAAPQPRAAEPLALQLEGDGPIPIAGPWCPPLQVSTPWGPVVVEAPLGRLTDAVVRGVAEAATSRPPVRVTRRRGAPVAIADPVDGTAAAAQAAWQRADRQVRSADVDWIAVPLAPLDDPAALSAALGDLLDGDRIAGCIGARSDEVPTVLGLRSGSLHRERYAVPGAPPRYLAVSVRHHADLGGFRAGLARHGVMAPALDFVQRALDAGLAVAHGDLPGPARQDSATDAERRRQHARGALVVGDGDGGTALRALSGAVPIVRSLRTGGASGGRLAAAGLGYVHGVVEGLRHPVREGRGTAGS